ncbi:MAG: aldehyde dehydrogenase family protein [Streptosporangiaceae bacterium]|nr:aldehyde dehydrogenase family protein [Streptosporangiaceae bacterium]
MLETVNPATGEVLAVFPVHGRREVDAALAAARPAAQWWADLDWNERRIRLLAWKSYLARYLGRLAQLVHEETGKPLDDAKLEITLAIVHIDWAARHARPVLRERRVRSGLVAANLTSWVEYQPLGVVGVIGPWNYPVFTPAGSIAYALAAGNAVVFKPSELTPAVGEALVRSFDEALRAAGDDPAQPVLQGVYGPGSTGEALVRSGVDKIAFTGSAATARKVMAAAADTLTPVVAECGGVGESGFGRIHAPDGLREFARAKVITRQRFGPPLRLTSSGRTERDMDRLVLFVTLVHGRLYRSRHRPRR